MHLSASAHRLALLGQPWLNQVRLSQLEGQIGIMMREALIRQNEEELCRKYSLQGLFCVLGQELHQVDIKESH